MLEIIFGIMIVILVIVVAFLFEKNQSLLLRVNQLSFAKSSQSVKYGKMSEQWIPLSEQFPFDSHQFRFLGSPIDGVAFEEDQIVFCEFKANTSQLSDKQKKIKKLVEEKKVSWLELNSRS